jgi:hypothetical protein
VEEVTAFIKSSGYDHEALETASKTFDFNLTQKKGEQRRPFLTNKFGRLLNEVLVESGFKFKLN